MFPSFKIIFKTKVAASFGILRKDPVSLMINRVTRLFPFLLIYCKKSSLQVQLAHNIIYLCLVLMCLNFNKPCMSRHLRNAYKVKTLYKYPSLQYLFKPDVITNHVSLSVLQNFGQVNHKMGRCLYLLSGSKVSSF